MSIFDSLKIDSLVNLENCTAALSFVEQETGIQLTAENIQRAYEITRYDPASVPVYMIRAFLCGEIYQSLFGGKKILSQTMIACVAHISSELEIGDSIVGSVHSVAEAMALDRNHPNAKGPFTRLARSFMAGAEWATKQ